MLVFKVRTQLYDPRRWLYIQFFYVESEFADENNQFLQPEEKIKVRQFLKINFFYVCLSVCSMG